MPDYYASDVTQMPLSVILSGGGLGFPWPLRLIFAFRKVLGWHYPAMSARTIPNRWQTLVDQELPLSLREDFLEKTREMERLGCTPFATNKGDIIGNQAIYTRILINSDRTSMGTITVVGSRVGTVSRKVWAVGFRTDFSDGVMLLTAAGPKMPTYLLRPHQQVESMPETTAVADVFRRHQERVNAMASSKPVLIPVEGTAEYLLAQAQADFMDFVANGMFREVTLEEVEALKNVTFDFDQGPPPLPGRSSQPVTAAYAETGGMEERVYELQGDRILVRSKDAKIWSDERAIMLNELRSTPEHGTLRVKQNGELTVSIVLLVVLLKIAQNAVRNGEIPVWLQVSLGVVGLATLYFGFYHRKIEYRAYSFKNGTVAFEVKRRGRNRNQFERFVEALEAAIKNAK